MLYLILYYVIFNKFKVILLLKMFKDIKNNFIQFIVIFLMAFMGIFVFLGISTELHGIQVYLKDYKVLKY